MGVTAIQPIQTGSQFTSVNGSVAAAKTRLVQDRFDRAQTHTMARPTFENVGVAIQANVAGPSHAKTSLADAAQDGIAIASGHGASITGAITGWTARIVTALVALPFAALVGLANVVGGMFGKRTETHAPLGFEASDVIDKSSNLAARAGAKLGGLPVAIVGGVTSAVVGGVLSVGQGVTESTVKGIATLVGNEEAAAGVEAPSSRASGMEAFRASMEASSTFVPRAEPGYWAGKIGARLIHRAGQEVVERQTHDATGKPDSEV